MPEPITNKFINPVLRGNLLNIHERINDLRPSFPHAIMLQQQIQKAFFMIKENNSAESELMLALFLEVDCKGVGSYDEGVFLRVQKQALVILSTVLELMPPT